MILAYETINVSRETFVRTGQENEVPTKRQHENDNGKRVTSATRNGRTTQTERTKQDHDGTTKR